jgi:tagatose-6-phosphate ketose/aldose isomerase
METESRFRRGNGNDAGPGHITAGEIYHQPLLWLDTFARMQKMSWRGWAGGNGILCGAGTSAYVAGAIQSAWTTSRAIPTTDLLTDPRALKNADFLLSIARSGDSPESVAVVDMARRDFPTLPQLAITCNPQGRLAQYSDIQLLLLDPRTNDRSLVMTSSFSNLVLAGLSLSHQEILREQLPVISSQVEQRLPELDSLAEKVAKSRPARAVILASAPLFPWAHETSLKILEMTAGRVAVLPETFLGLRHGPMSFLDRETLVICLISNDPRRRSYETDLINELKTKQLGRLVCIAPSDFSDDGLDTHSVALAPDIPDYLRAPFEIVFSQLLAYHMSLNAGLNPDSPSPSGAISRVVSGVKVY